jgi:hypothetical protein
MELEELKTMWQKYDSKLDHLEKLNKKLIIETLSRKPQKKLDWMKYQNLYGIIMTPIVLVVALHSQFKIENIDGKFIIGCLLVLAVVIYITYYFFKSHMILKGIDISHDSIIDSARKVNNFKSNFIKRHKFTFISYAIVFIGILLIAWKGFHFNTGKIITMILFFFAVFYFGYKRGEIYITRIENLEKEILELKEYEN